MAAVDSVPATHGVGGGGSGATAAVEAAPAPSTLVPAASAICCVAASAYVSVSSLLAYHATFAVSLLCFARAAWPDRVDAVLGPVGAYARRAALLARADLEADLRRLRDAARANAFTAPVCTGAEERARRAPAAVAGCADGSAWLVLRLLGRVLRLAAGVLLDAAREETKAQAPSVQEYLRGVARGVRSSPASCKEGEDDEGFVLEDIVSLVGHPAKWAANRTATTPIHASMLSNDNPD